MSVYSSVPSSYMALSELGLGCVSEIPFDPALMTLSHHEFVRVSPPRSSQSVDIGSTDLRPVLLPMSEQPNGLIDVPVEAIKKWLETYVLSTTPGCHDVSVSLPLHDDDVFKRFSGLIQDFNPSFIVQLVVGDTQKFRFFKLEDTVISDDERQSDWYLLNLP